MPGMTCVRRENDVEFVVHTGVSIAEYPTERGAIDALTMILQ